MAKPSAHIEPRPVEQPTASTDGTDIRIADSDLYAEIVVDSSDGVIADEPATTNDTDQYFQSDEYEFMEDERELSQIASADAAVKFLRERCDLHVSHATISRHLAGGFWQLDFTIPGLYRWANAAFGSFVHPTFTPAHGIVKPPRVMLVSECDYDSRCLIAQLNAFGADVIGPVPYGDDVDTRRLTPTKSSADAVRIAATAEFDVAWLEITNVQPLVFVSDWLHERGIPYLVSPRKLPSLPQAVRANGLLLPERPMVADIPRLIAERFPQHILARLDLTRPLVEEWHDVEYYVANGGWV